MGKFYVYAYLDPRKTGAFTGGGVTFYYEPFYIGKGSGTRSHSHLKEAERALIEGTKTRDLVNPKKLNKIIKLLKEGLIPKIVRIKKGMTEAEALQLEQRLIQAFHPKGMLTNSRTTAWARGEVYSRGVGGMKPGGVGIRKDTQLYYDPDRKQHYVVTPSKLKQLQKKGLASSETVRARNPKDTEHPQKARHGETNGMFGKPSVHTGKKWYTVDGTAKMLHTHDVKVLRRSGAIVELGRKTLISSCSKARQVGKRIIFKGETNSKYRTQKDIDANPKKLYQYGLAWNPAKPTYRNRRRIN